MLRALIVWPRQTLILLVSDLPVRIAFCITELDPGGAERALVRIVTGLDRTRWQPYVYCLAAPGPLAEPLAAADVPVTCLGVRSSRDVGVVRRLSKELATFRPEILQTFLFHGNIVGRLAARWAKVPIVVAGVRVVEPDARWRMRLDHGTSRLVDRTICVSAAVAERYRELGYRDDQLAVVANGVDIARFAGVAPGDLSEMGIPAGARTVLSVGRLHPQKGLPHLLAAFEQVVRDTEDEVHLLIVGEGPQRDVLLADIEQRRLGDRVHMAGWRPDIPSLLRAADLFVLSSLWEGMPNVLLEAMAAGLPCVATDVEGVAELISDGETGLLVRRGDSPALAEQIARLLADASLASRVAAAGQAHVRKGYTWEATIRGFETIWDELLQQRHHHMRSDRSQKGE